MAIACLLSEGRLRATNASAPITWPTAPVSDCHDLYQICCLLAINHEIRKPRESKPSAIVINNWPPLRRLQDNLNRSIKFMQKTQREHACCALRTNSSLLLLRLELRGGFPAAEGSFWQLGQKPHASFSPGDPADRAGVQFCYSAANLTQPCFFRTWIGLLIQAVPQGISQRCPGLGGKFQCLF